MHLDLKAKNMTLWCSEPQKLDALEDVLNNKLIKRGVSLLALEKGTEEAAFGSSVRVVITVQAGISKEKGKEVIGSLKESKLKVQAQIQDEKVRVTAKSRDELQQAIAHLRTKQEALKLPLQFGNFRDWFNK